MTLAEAKKTVSVVAYLEEVGIALPGHAAGTTAEGNTFYRLDPCPVCGHRDHFDVFPDTNTYCSRSGCTEGSSIIDLIMDLEGISQGEAINNVKERAGIPVTSRSTAVEDFSPTEKPPAGSVSGGTPAAAVASADYTDLIASWYHKTTPEEKQYFIDRGIPGTLVDNYKLCFGDVYNKHTGRKERRAIFTAWDNDKCIYYAARTINGAEPKYLNPTGPKPIVNLHMLQGEGGLVAVIVEGIADALAVEATTGVPGVATLGKVTNALKAVLKDTAGALVLTAFDNDEAGEENRRALSQYDAVVIPADYKDVGEWVQHEPDGLGAAVEGVKAAVKTKGSVTEYLTGGAFMQDLENNTNAPRLSTGFNVLDSWLNGGLYPGLCVLGGQSGVGKTAFILQLADGMASQGNPVLFFTLEMTRYEMVCRSLARLMRAGGVADFSTGLILNGAADTELVDRYVKRYSDTIGNHMFMYEGGFTTTMETVREEVARVAARVGKSPVIIVDYLQVLQRPEKEKGGDYRMTIDANVSELKQLSKNYSTQVIILSSFNRTATKYEKVSMESFKESGLIEYTSDILIGLGNHKPEEGEPAFVKTSSKDIALTLLKNRRGRAGAHQKLVLDYLPAFNLFKCETDNGRVQPFKAR